MSESTPSRQLTSAIGALMFAATIAISGCGADEREGADLDDAGYGESTAARQDDYSAAEPRDGTSDYPGADAEGGIAGSGMADDPEAPGTVSSTVGTSGETGAPAGVRDDDSSVIEGERTARAEIEPVDGSGVAGRLAFREQDGELRIEGEITGLEPGEHGLHIHVTGDCSAPEEDSAGGHLAANDGSHGSPEDEASEHHVGDLGNISANEEGVANVDKSDEELTLALSETSVVDRAVVIHAGADDMETQPSGDSGTPVGCGVILASNQESVATSD